MNKESEYAKENNLILSVAKKYYESRMNQEDIAQEEFISKSSVSRLIKKAADKGFVVCRINYPNAELKLLQDELYCRFKLSKVYVESEQHIDRLYAVAAEDVCRLINTGGILAVAPGTALNKFADACAAYDGQIKNLSAVISVMGLTDGFEDSVSKTAKAFSAPGYIVPAPLVANNAEIKDIFLADSHIAHAFDLMKNSDYIIAEIMDGDTAAGCIAGHYYDINGNIADKGLDSRTVSLPLDDIKKKDKRAAIAVGKKSTRAVIGALNGGIINMLYIDAQMAKSVINA